MAQVTDNEDTTIVDDADEDEEENLTVTTEYGGEYPNQNSQAFIAS